MTFSYNALLNAFAKMGMMAAAREVFMGMQETGPQLDIVTYNTMLAGYAQVLPCLPVCIVSTLMEGMSCTSPVCSCARKKFLAGVLLPDEDPMDPQDISIWFAKGELNPV